MNAGNMLPYVGPQIAMRMAEGSKSELDVTVHLCLRFF